MTARNGTVQDPVEKLLTIIGPAKPTVIVNATSLGQQSAIVADALRNLSGSSAVYGRGDDLCQVEADPDDGYARLRSLDLDSLPGVADLAVSFVKINSKDEMLPTYPPIPVIRDVLSRYAWQLPRLRQLLTAPAILPDGRLLDVEGYDADSWSVFELSAGICTAAD